MECQTEVEHQDNYEVGAELWFRMMMNLVI